MSTYQGLLITPGEEERSEVEVTSTLKLSFSVVNDLVVFWLESQ